MTTSIIGFPRIGEHRELKFATEKYFQVMTSPSTIPSWTLLSSSISYLSKFKPLT